MAIARADSPTDEITIRRELLILIKRVLDRIYVDGVDKLLKVKPDEKGNVSGYFIGDRQLFEFDFTDGKVNYNLAQRQDSWVEGFLANTRLDAPRSKKKRCTKGYPCGDGCIAKGLRCKSSLSRYATPNETQKIRQLALRLKSPTQSASPATQFDPLDAMTIRDLKKEASRYQVTGYSNMTSEQLRKSIRQVKADPDWQGRTEKILASRRRQREKVLSVLPKDLARTWRKITKITKLVQTNPEYTGLLAAALVTSVAVTTMQKIKERYKDGLDDSAKMALDRAGKVPLENIQGKPGILFAVGGLNTGTPGGAKIKELLETPRDGTPGEKWFKQNNHIIAFDHPSSAIAPPSFSAKNPDGSYNPAYLGFLAKAGFGKSIENWRQNGRNEAAVDLAAQLYAYGSQHKNADINLIGHGSGGATVREAAEILSRMNPAKGGAKGANIVRRTNVVNTGSPYFGFTDDKFWKEVKNRTLVSRQDPTSILPAKLPQFVNSVKGHEIGDFLENNEVRERIRETFGYYTSSLEARRKQAENRAAFRSGIGEVLTDVSPVAGRLFKRINRIADMSDRNPAAASILAGTTLLGTSYGTYRFLKNRYNASLDDSAKAARELYTQQYGKDGTPSVTRANVMFTVGSSTSSSEAIAQEIETNNITAAGGQKYQTVPFTPQMGADEYPSPPAELREGTPEYNAWIAQHEYARTLGRTLKGAATSVPIPGVSKGANLRNPEAIKLAAQVYAYGKATQKKNFGKKPIAMLAHGAGGMTAREAIQILEKMEPDGPAIAKRIKLATMGTPSFGISNSTTETSLHAKNDFFSRFPKKGKGQSTTYEGIAGRDSKHYLANPEARAQIERTFAGEQESKERKTAQAQRAANTEERAKTARQQEAERQRKVLMEARERAKTAAKTARQQETERQRKVLMEARERAKAARQQETERQRKVLMEARERAKTARQQETERKRKVLMEEAIASLNRKNATKPINPQNVNPREAARIEREMGRLRRQKRIQEEAKGIAPPLPRNEQGNAPQTAVTSRVETQYRKRQARNEQGNAPQTAVTSEMARIIQQINQDRPPGEKIDPNNLTASDRAAIAKLKKRKRK